MAAPTRKLAAFIALFAALALVLAACGGDAGDELVQPDGTVATEPGSGNDDSTGDPASSAVDTATGGGGRATVQVNELTFEAQSEFCFATPGFFQFDGLGTTDPGDGPSTTAWISISGSRNEDYDGDGENDTAATVAVEFGKGEAVGSTEEGQPELQADVVEFSAAASAGVGESMFVFTIDGDSISGEGEIQDYSGVLLDFGERASLSFDASC